MDYSDEDFSVLLLEDDLLAQMTVSSILNDMGITKVTCVTSIDDALGACEEENFNVVFCDIYLQGHPSGKDLIPAIKGKSLTKIILQTGLPKDSVIGNNDYKDVDYVLFKPYNYDEIKRIVAEIIDAN